MRNELVAVAVFLLLAGCQGAGKGTDVIEQPALAAPAFGNVYGTVTDDEAQPLAGVQVTLAQAGFSGATRADGQYEIDHVPEGDYALVFAEQNFTSVTRTVSVLRDLDVRADAKLVKLPALRPHNETVLLHGNYDCAAEYLIITGHCGIAVTRVACMASHCMDDPVFTQKYEFRFNVSEHWESIVAELRWTSSPSNVLDGMRLYVENTNVTEEAGHSVKVARADGNTQPLSLRIDRGHLHPEAETYNGTTQKAYIPDEGGLEQARVFPKGMFYDETSQVCSPQDGCFLGVGTGFNIQFDLYLTQFYNEPAPAGFTAIPAGI